MCDVVVVVVVGCYVGIVVDTVCVYVGYGGVGMPLLLLALLLLMDRSLSCYGVCVIDVAGAADVGCGACVDCCIWCCCLLCVVVGVVVTVGGVVFVVVGIVGTVAVAGCDVGNTICVAFVVDEIGCVAGDAGVVVDCVI